MCWNPEVSISTYLFSAIPVTLCYIYGLLKLPFFLVFQSFISMQLVEYFLWTYLEDDKLNRYFSILGWTLIFLQPIFSILSIHPSLNSYKYIALLSYLIYILYILFTEKTEFKTVVATNKHLQWKWLDYPLHIVLIWLFFFCLQMIISPKKISRYALLFIIVNFSISYYYFEKSKAWGSMWCWSSNLIGLFYYYVLFVYLYTHKNILH
jgi:hypothetical protein